MLVSELITQSFLDMGTIQPGEVITADMQSDAFTRLNQLLGSLSAEGTTAFNQIMQNFVLVAGQPAYTLGVGGTFGTLTRAQRATAWRASYGGILSRGGMVLSIPDFDAQAMQHGGELASIPQIVGADTAFPLVNLRVWPPPSAQPGLLELAYWTPVTAFVAPTDVIALPQGWEDMLHFNLAIKLYPQYARQGGIPPELAANAQNSKLALVQQNLGATAPAAAQ